MIKNILSITLIILLFLASCKGKNGKAKTDVKDTTQRFPLIELLQNDADDVIKTPYYIYQKSTDVSKNKVIDSTPLSRDEFKKIIQPITTADIGSEKGKENFTETSFADLSMETISVIVTAKKSTQQLQRITALFDDKKNTFKNATITLLQPVKDTSVTKKIFWKIGKSMNIATTKTIKDSIVSETIQLISWNDSKQ